MWLTIHQKGPGLNLPALVIFDEKSAERGASFG
jgi:hypothetical protein